MAASSSEASTSVKVSTSVTPSLMGYYSFNRPRRDGRLSWPCWLTDSGRLTHKVVTRPAISLAQDRESSPARTGSLTTVLRHQLRHQRSYMFAYVCLHPMLCGRRHTVFVLFTRVCISASMWVSWNIINMISCREFDTFSPNLRQWCITWQRWMRYNLASKVEGRGRIK